MKQKDLFTKIFNIRHEEAKPVFLMMLFSFFIGLSLTFYFTASNAIFVRHFAPKMIPVSFIASGIIVYLAWWFFSKIDKKTSVSRQVITKFLFVFISVLAISIGVWKFESDWLVFIMYTWVRVMVYISLVNFWGTAGRLFNIRQGKRIFGLISVGEVISIIIGYLSIPLILKVIKVSDLLFLASGSLFASVVMAVIIFRTFKTELNAAKAPPAKTTTSTKSEWSYWNLLKKPYFVMISLMALLPIFGYLFVDYLFLAQAKHEFVNDPKTFASFLGLFLGAVAIVELFFKLFSGRFLTKYGLKPSLLVLPTILISCISLAAIFGTLYGTVGMIFAFIAMARFFERSVRGSFYEPAFQLLYQPVPSEQRLPFQNQIEGIPKAMGTVITGCVILLFSAVPAFTLVHFNWLFIIVLGFWIWIAFKMYVEYRNMLKSKLVELKHADREETDPMDGLIRQSFMEARPGQYQKIFEFFEKVEPARIEAAVQGTPAESWQAEKQDKEQPYEFMVDLARSEEAWERVKVARILGNSNRYSSYKLLINLLKDHDPAVKKAAIISSGRIRRVELWPHIIENLLVPEYSHAAGMAVRMIGEPILQDLDKFFDKNGSHPQAQLKIIKIYGLIGGPKVIKFLRNKIHHPNQEIRFQVLLSLSNLEYHASALETPFIKETIENSVETMVWSMASIIDIGGAAESTNLQQALLQELEEKKEQMFLLLSLLYDSKTIGHIREHIESADNTAKIYALEISDMMISTEIKELFFPIFDDLPIQDRLNRFSQHFPQEKLSVFERVEEIVNKDYAKINRWTKACAIDLLSRVEAGEPEQVRKLLAANLVNPEPVLAELAGWILYSYHRFYFEETIARFEKQESRIAGVVKKIEAREKNKDLLIFEKVQMLKNMEILAMENETTLLNLVSGVKNKEFKIPNESLFELMTGDPVMTERYLRVYILNKNA